MTEKNPLDVIERQRKDIEELTNACRALFRQNRRLQDELKRSENASPSLDHGPRREPRRVAKRDRGASFPHRRIGGEKAGSDDS
jgi:uncharacterized membrane protein YccC